MDRYMPLMIFSLSLFLLNCKTHYVADSFEYRTAEHQTVAVLPFEMIYTGLKPEGLTDEDMREIEIAESQAFQISFFHEILRSTRGGKNAIRINLQDYRKTLHLLEENDMDIKSSWMEEPEMLAYILGVDAVLRARIEKHRLMSDLESYGINVAVHIMGVLTEHRMWPWLPTDVTRSKEITTSYTLIDGDDGHVLWSVNKKINADWRSASNEIIDNVNRKAAKHFPYRI